MQQPLEQAVAETILQRFESFYSRFLEITQGSKSRFENSDWLGVQLAGRERIRLYDHHVGATTARIKQMMGEHHATQSLLKQVKGAFSDLLPRNHPYVEVNNQFKQTFGGSNMVSIMLEVEQGDVFNPTVLAKVRQVTQALQKVEGVDTYQIASLASKKMKEVRASTEGIESKPLMWPGLPKDAGEIAVLREAVLGALEEGLVTAGHVVSFLCCVRKAALSRRQAGRVHRTGQELRTARETPRRAPPGSPYASTPSRWRGSTIPSSTICSPGVASTAATSR